MNRLVDEIEEEALREKAPFRGLLVPPVVSLATMTHAEVEELPSLIGEAVRAFELAGR